MEGRTQVVAMLSSDECAALVSDAEAYAAQWGWTTSRHTISKVFFTEGLSLVNGLGHLLLRISDPPPINKGTRRMRPQTFPCNSCLRVGGFGMGR